jgi:phenylacetate-CoA ligase
LILRDVQELTGEYICRVEKISDADVMTVICESRDVEKKLELVERTRLILRQRLGVRLEVEITQVGGTAELTQINARQKPIRLIDLRK